MSRRTRYKEFDNSSDYTKGYLAGQKAAFEESELDAYYAGVGYGKKTAKTKHIGFSSPEERRNFESGMRNHNKHFHSYRGELTFFEKIFGRKKTEKRIDYADMPKKSSRSGKRK